MSKRAIIIFSVVVIFLLIFYFQRRKKFEIKTGEMQGDNILNMELIETWDKVSDKIIRELHPSVRLSFVNLINELKNEYGITYRVYSGLRTFDEQDKLYGKGRTINDLQNVGVNPEYANPQATKVTNAKGGESYHNYGLAADGVEIIKGTADWSYRNFDIIKKTGEKYGLYSGGNFSSPDKPHFEKRIETLKELLVLYKNNQKDSDGYVIV